MIRLLLALAGIAACTAEKPADTDTAPTPDTADTDTADTDTADTDTADTDTADTDTALPPPGVADLAVTLHPDVATVLVATWTQTDPGATWLSWQFEGETFHSPVVVREPGVVTEYVFGLPALTGVALTLHASADATADPTDPATAALSTPGGTGPLPAELPVPTLALATPDADPAPYLLTSVNVGERNFFGPCWLVILDRAGRVVWYRAATDTRLTLFPRVARSGGHLYWEASTYYAPGEPALHRARLALDVVEEIPIPLGFTWDELPDGTFVFDEAVSPYEYHLARTLPDGTTARIWACNPWMEPFSTGFWACAANTAAYDPETGGVLWSMFETSTVVAIGLETGEILWELGEYPGGLAFDPADIRLELQHYPNRTPTGTVLLTTHVPGDRRQHIREFAIDGATATQIWDYTAEGYYGDYAGEAIRLPAGNTLINFGTDGVLREVTPAGEVAWELDWADHLLGHVTPIDDLYALNAGW